jgi:hypothetical protein
VDRRADELDRPEPAKSPPKSALAIGKAKLTAPSVVAAEARVEPGELRFGFVPFARGDTITIETQFRIRALLNTSFQGLSKSEDAEVDARERIEIKIVEASPDGVRVLEVFYAESKSVFRFGDAPDDEDSSTGKRYRVTFEAGKPRVARDRGALEPEEEKGVIFDLGSVTGYLPLVRPLLPKTLSSGFSARMGASELTDVFGALDTVKLDSGSLRLRGRDTKRPEAALFECGLPLRIDRDGATFSVDLTGTCSVRTSDTRPLEIRMNGPLRAAAGAAFTSASTLTGTLEAEVKHSYGKDTG